MRNLFISFSFVFLTLVGCSPRDSSFILDSFEGEVNSSTVDFGSSRGSSVEVEAEKDIVKCGNQALKITYNLKHSGYMWVARGYGLDVEGAAAWSAAPKDIEWAKYNTISFYMYGTASGTVIAFDVKDRDGELWRFLVDDDFSGWKEIVCPFSQFFPRSDWQPDGASLNEELDFPLMSFQFEPRMPGENYLLIDCVSLKNK
ncbi:MAG: hypothetical protein GF375_02400 [Candidatus Omnitrophica bacterium]|nr:hypothetical protein [Candidatus Omnitrophota bacterium]MBD3268951.1 hypothetical protein [Candidatus Omnitrophota bacterium]